MNETLGKAHFWLTFAGVYCIFMPMHWMGLLTESTMFPEAQRVVLASAGESIRTLVTAATIWTVGGASLVCREFLWQLVAPGKSGSG